MSQEKTTLEIIAPSVEEAITRGLDQLGLTQDAVVVEILDNGSRGLLGIGGRQSRVRLSIKDAAEEPKKAETVIESVENESEKESAQYVEVAEADLTEEEKKSIKVTQDVVFELLERMHIKATINTKYIEPVDENDERLVLVDIQGNDLSILLGRRSETLNALQYITSLIVSKELNRWVPMMIDVQGYRARRERSLRQLGRRMAQQAIETGKRQILEPMPANERRVIHLELRDSTEVITESTGDEPFRKVTIVPKK
ncbi:MAG: RNA-binding cell elongation regulator Jag/EloR [Anaerolineaceae bacterium]